MSRPRPEAGVEYAAWPTAAYHAHRVTEASRGLASWLGVTEVRAAGLLDGDPAVLAAEIRARRADPMVALRMLERRYRLP